MLALQNGGRPREFPRMAPLPDNLNREKRALGRAMRRVRERQGMTQAQAAKRLGVLDQQWQRWESGERNPRLAKIPEIAAAIDVTPEELLAERSRVIGLDDLGPVAPEPGLVGLYGYAAGAGERLTIASGSEMRWVPMHPAQVGYRKVGAVEIVGESMYPRWKPREIAYFVFDLSPPRGEDVIAELQDGTAIIKEYVGRIGDKLQFREFFPQERIFEIPAEEIRALHAVVG